ncbi:MAG: serpin family protein [Phycisphaerales bacterium]
MRSIVLAPLLLSLLAPAASAEPVPAKPTPPSPGVIAAAANETMFSKDLLTQLTEQQQGNAFYSPLSIHTALEMARLGAKGATRDAMSKVMRMEGPDALQQMAALQSQVQQSTRGKNSAFQIDTANRLWTSQGLKLTNGYAMQLKAGFNADAKEIDFADKSASANAVNAWVSKQTNAMIPRLVDPSHIPDAGFILTNAIYFKALWKFPFEKSRTRPQPFTLEDGTKADVPMMHQSDQFGYVKLPNFAAVTLPYRGAASMIVVLPDEGKMKETVAELDIPVIRAALALQEVRITLPKVDIKTRFSVRSTLIAMGMGAAFDPNADFTGITPTQPGYISEVLHAAALKMDEEKTEAAAATGVIGTVSSRVPPKAIEFTVDRPFLVFILHEPTGAVLFAGKIADPRK